MKRILGIFGLLCLGLITCTVLAATNVLPSVKYTVTIKQSNNISGQSTVYRKGNKEKIISQGLISYVNTSTNESIIYNPQAKMAMRVVSQPDNTGIPSSATINEYKKYFTKSGTKVLNGYTCTVYKSTAKGIEACISETYMIPIYIKTPEYYMQVSNISTNAIADSEFQVPTGVPIQDMNNYMSASKIPNTTYQTNTTISSKNTNMNTSSQNTVVQANKQSTSSTIKNPRSTNITIVPKDKSKVIGGRVVDVITVTIPSDCVSMTDLKEVLQKECTNRGSNMKLATPETIKNLFTNHFNELDSLGLVRDGMYLRETLCSKDNKLYSIRCGNIYGDMQCSYGSVPANAVRFSKATQTVICVPSS